MNGLVRQFRVMQWNGLAKKAAIGDRYNNKWCKEIEDWDNFRKWRVLEEVVRYNSDIICLEEADFYEDIKHHLHHLG